MKVLSFSGSELRFSNYFSQLQDLCLQATQEKRLSRDNYDVIDWQIKPPTLFHLLFAEERFSSPHGVFNLLLEDEQIVAFAGAYQLWTEPTTLIALARAYTLPAYRSRQVLGRYLLPEQVTFGRSQGCKKVWLTFNNYNEPIYQALQRIAAGQAITLGAENLAIYKDFKFLSSQQNIKDTWQFVAEKNLEITCT